MSERILQIHIETPEAAMRRFANIWKAAEAGQDPVPSEHQSFATWEQFTSGFSAKRRELLATLSVCQPCSVRALAAQLGRDDKSVHSDVKALLDLGFITKDAQDRLLAPYEKLIAEFDFGRPEAAE
jgi:predicted transcriptional regulator